MSVPSHSCLIGGGIVQLIPTQPACACPLRRAQVGAMTSIHPQNHALSPCSNGRLAGRSIYYRVNRLALKIGTFPPDAKSKVKGSLVTIGRCGETKKMRGNSLSDRPHQTILGYLIG